MRVALTVLIPALFLFGCSKEPVAWEDKSPEQQNKERSFMSSCYAKHFKDRNWDVCKNEFEEKFGYPYQGSIKN